MTTPVIELKNVSYRYMDANRDAVKNLSLTIHKGEWIAMIGSNGSGKSTTAKIINGLLVPYEGQVFVNGMELNAETVWDVRKLIGMVFQNPDNQFVGATVEDDVAFGLENIGLPREEMLVRIPQALEAVRMTEFAKHEPSRLSGGQKQRVALASVIAARPEIIILDEATAMLDPRGRREMMEAIDKLQNQYGLTVISITHDIDEASRADRIVVLNQGELYQQAKPAELFALGEEIIKLGLDVPFVEKLRAALVQRGVKVPQEYMTEEEMITWLTTSYLTK